jgi:hypothetical protein
MRPARMLVGLSVTATAVVFAGSSPAHAATGLLDGTLDVNGTTCSFANAVTSDTPPNTLTLDRTTVHVTCADGTPVSVTNNPTVTFNDTAGTATANSIDVTATVFGVTCGYRASNVVGNRQGTTRTYAGGPYTASKISGGFLCPGTETINSASLTFH